MFGGGSKSPVPPPPLVPAPPPNPPTYASAASSSPISLGTGRYAGLDQSILTSPLGAPATGEIRRKSLLGQ